MNKSFIVIFALIMLAHQAFAQKHEPIIDVHLHGHPLWTRPDTAWYPKQWKRPASEDELMRLTIKELDRYNIVKAVLSGNNRQVVDKWIASAPNRFLVGSGEIEYIKPDDIEKMRKRIQTGEVNVFAEISSQYGGIGASDTLLEPLYKLAEEYDIPVGIHIGIGPPDVAEVGKYRSRLSSPLMLEEAISRHPKMRFYVMHAGWPMLDDMVAMLYAFSNLYVDISVINWYIPRAEFYTYLKRLVDAGFSKRIMYGSDQMQWPQSIGPSIESIEAAPFLTREQKRDIFYNNAVRFFKLSDNEKGK